MPAFGPAFFVSVSPHNRIQHPGKVRRTGRQPRFHRRKPVPGQFLLKGIHAHHPAGCPCDLHGFPCSLVDPFLGLKGRPNIALGLCLTITHSTDQSPSLGLQMALDEPIESLPVLLQHQHMEHGHGIDEIKGFLHGPRNAVQHLKMFCKIRGFLLAEGNRFG